MGVGAAAAWAAPQVVSVDAASAATVAPVVVPITAIDGCNGTFIAATSDGRAFLTTDGGDIWGELATTVPPGTDLEAVSVNFQNDPQAHGHRRVHRLERGGDQRHRRRVPHAGVAGVDLVGADDGAGLRPERGGPGPAPGDQRARYWARPPTASLLSRLLRCRPSSTSSTAAATDAGDSSPPVRRETGSRSAGTSDSSCT